LSFYDDKRASPLATDKRASPLATALTHSLSLLPVPLAPVGVAGATKTWALARRPWAS